MPQLADWLTGKVMQISDLYAGHRRSRRCRGEKEDARARLQMHTRPVGISGLCCTQRNMHTHRRTHTQTGMTEQSSLRD